MLYLYLLSSLIHNGGGYTCQIKTEPFSAVLRRFFAKVMKFIGLSIKVLLVTPG